MYINIYNVFYLYLGIAISVLNSNYYRVNARLIFYLFYYTKMYIYRCVFYAQGVLINHISSIIVIHTYASKVNLL